MWKNAARLMGGRTLQVSSNRFDEIRAALLDAQQHFKLCSTWSHSVRSSSRKTRPANIIMFSIKWPLWDAGLSVLKWQCHLQGTYPILRRTHVFTLTVGMSGAKGYMEWWQTCDGDFDADSPVASMILDKQNVVWHLSRGYQAFCNRRYSLKFHHV